MHKLLRFQYRLWVLLRQWHYVDENSSSFGCVSKCQWFECVCGMALCMSSSAESRARERMRAMDSESVLREWNFRVDVRHVCVLCLCWSEIHYCDRVRCCVFVSSFQTLNASERDDYVAQRQRSVHINQNNNRSLSEIDEATNEQTHVRNWQNKFTVSSEWENKWKTK